MSFILFTTETTTKLWKWVSANKKFQTMIQELHNKVILMEISKKS